MVRLQSDEEEGAAAAEGAPPEGEAAEAGAPARPDSSDDEREPGRATSEMTGGMSDFEIMLMRKKVLLRRGPTSLGLTREVARWPGGL